MEDLQSAEVGLMPLDTALLTTAAAAESGPVPFQVLGELTSKKRCRCQLPGDLMMILP